jgi:hypothetical protein
MRVVLIGQLGLSVLATFALATSSGCFVPAGGGAAGGKTTPQWWQSSVTLANQSSYAIEHLFLSPQNQGSWGPDQLGADILASGQTVKFDGIDCDTYDLRLVDEDGDECVVPGVDLCLEDAQWELTDEALLSCQWGS